MVYLAIAGIILIPAACLLLAGLLSGHLDPSESKKEAAAHAEALRYLAGVIRTGSSRAPDPSLIRSRVDLILKVLEYPKCGNVGDWESSTAAIIYPTEDEPSQPWDNIMAECFEFARVNLYCGFTKQRNVTAYERVRSALSSAGVEARPVEELRLGRVTPAAIGTRI